MIKLRKCCRCKKYTLKKNCEKCNLPTKLAGYKFVRVSKPAHSLK